MSANGSSADAIQEKITAQERSIVLEAFAHMKSLKGDAELRVTVTKDRTSGEIEIIYVGVHEKRSLKEIRAMYDLRRGQKRDLGVIRR